MEEEQNKNQNSKKSKIKTWKDLEFEIRLFGKCNTKSLSYMSIGQILTSLSSEIESSISGDESPREGFFEKYRNRRRFNHFIRDGKWNTKWKFPKLPLEHQNLDSEECLLRLKTAMTAFRLHSGPFAKHPEFGILEKYQWENLHLKVADYLLSWVEWEGRENFVKQNKKPYKGKKRYNKKNYKGKNKSE